MDIPFFFETPIVSISDGAFDRYLRHLYYGYGAKKHV